MREGINLCIWDVVMKSVAEFLIWLECITPPTWWSN